MLSFFFIPCSPLWRNYVFRNSFCTRFACASNARLHRIKRPKELFNLMNKRSHIVFLIKTFSLRALFFHVYFMFDSCCGVIISFNCLIWCIIVLNNVQKQMTIEIDVTMYIRPVSGAFNTITWKKFWKIHNDFIKMVFQKKKCFWESKAIWI